MLIFPNFYVYTCLIQYELFGSQHYYLSCKFENLWHYTSFVQKTLLCWESEIIHNQKCSYSREQIFFIITLKFKQTWKSVNRCDIIIITVKKRTHSPWINSKRFALNSHWLLSKSVLVEDFDIGFEIHVYGGSNTPGPNKSASKCWGLLQNHKAITEEMIPETRRRSHLIQDLSEPW